MPSIEAHEHADDRPSCIHDRHARKPRAIGGPGRLPAQVRSLHRSAVDDSSQRQNSAFGFQGEAGAGPWPLRRGHGRRHL